MAYLGLDLGAGSGRAVVGLLDHNRLKVKEINRFANAPVWMNGTLYWNTLYLWGHIVESMQMCRREGYSKLSGIGVDTWGVDFGLLGGDGQLLANPVCYRDGRTEGIERTITGGIDQQALYQLTGMSLSRFTTFAQLLAVKGTRGNETLRTAKTLLMMPDLFRYALCGQADGELTTVGSSQLVNIRTGRWSDTLFKRFKLSRRLMPKIVKPGTVTGPMLPDVCRQAGIASGPVIAVAGHDTPSAAAAVPFTEEDTCFLSCGTWSVLGILLDRPITSTSACELGFVNEFGLDKVLFVKNTMGFYLLESLRRTWRQGGVPLSYSQIVTAAAAAKPFSLFLDVNAPMFFAAEGVDQAVRSFLRRAGQRMRARRGTILRTIFEGLAFSYRQDLGELEDLTGRRFKRISLVGGGARNRLLCQMIADATGCEVVAGPVEATVAGNLAIQALATGQLGSPSEISGLMKRSFKLTPYKPRRATNWDKNVDRYMKVVEKAQTA